MRLPSTTSTSGGRGRLGCRLGCLLLLVAPAIMLVRGLGEPRRVEITHPSVSVAGLPSAFDGLRVAVLTDIHHGPYLSRQRVRRIVQLANAQTPDLAVILGDVVHRHPRYIAPAWEELSRLRAPLGVYAVLGNHDYWEGAAETRQAMARAGITEATQRAFALRRQGQTLYLVGLDDLWEGHADLKAALAPVPPNQRVLVITHHPDVFMQQHDPRAVVWLAGHTHGGQVVLPWLMPPVVPSQYGQTLRAGWVERDGCRIYVSRGLGCITPPLRLNCRPELPVIVLHRAP